MEPTVVTTAPTWLSVSPGTEKIATNKHGMSPDIDFLLDDRVLGWLVGHSASVSGGTHLCWGRGGCPRGQPPGRRPGSQWMKPPQSGEFCL